MKKNDKVYLIILIAVILLVLVYFVRYFFMYRNIRSNTIDENISTDIYGSSEPSYIINEQNQIVYTEQTEQKLSSYSTQIIDKDENRQTNIKLVCEAINGYIVKSGEEFSFNTAAGPMGKDQGYKKAVSFTSTGKKFKAYGGGVCQLSSTLYNACLNASLEITERHPHSRRVSYVPQGKDATIYYGSKDFKFKNNTENDIKIECYSDGLKVDVTLYKITTTT